MRHATWLGCLTATALGEVVCAGMRATHSVPPRQPGNLSVTVEGNAATLAWAEPDLTDRPVVLFDGRPRSMTYQVYHAVGDPEALQSVPSEPMADLKFRAEGLEWGVRHCFAVAAVVDGVEGLTARPICVWVPPAAPTDIQAQPTSRSVRLSWTPPTRATGYNVYLIGGAHDSAILLNAQPLDTAAFTATGLTNLAPYAFRVTSIGEGGEGPPSAEITATPSPCAGLTRDYVFLVDLHPPLSSTLSAGTTYAISGTICYALHSATEGYIRVFAMGSSAFGAAGSRVATPEGTLTFSISAAAPSKPHASTISAYLYVPRGSSPGSIRVLSTDRDDYAVAALPWIRISRATPELGSLVGDGPLTFSVDVEYSTGGGPPMEVNLEARSNGLPGGSRTELDAPGLKQLTADPTGTLSYSQVTVDPECDSSSVMVSANAFTSETVDDRTVRSWVANDTASFPRNPHDLCVRFANDLGETITSVDFDSCSGTARTIRVESTADPLHVTLEETADWFALSGTSGVTPFSLDLNIDRSAVGDRTLALDQIEVSAPGAENDPMDFLVWYLQDEPCP